MTPFEINPAPDAVHLRLNGEVINELACALHAALVAALAEPARPLLVDVTSLTRIDAAALQVMLAAARVAPRAQLTAASSVWTAALQRHGLTDPFAQP